MNKVERPVRHPIAQQPQLPLDRDTVGCPVMVAGNKIERDGAAFAPGRDRRDHSRGQAVQSMKEIAHHKDARRAEGRNGSRESIQGLLDQPIRDGVGQERARVSKCVGLAQMQVAHQQRSASRPERDAKRRQNQPLAAKGDLNASR